MMWRPNLTLATVALAGGCATLDPQPLPLRDDCAREAASTWPFIAEYAPPTDRPLTRRELEARTFLVLCRHREQWREVEEAYQRNETLQRELERQWRLSERVQEILQE